MADSMMRLGFLEFSIDGPAYQELMRSTEYRWAAVPRLGSNDALQFVGAGSDSVELRGVIYPEFRGGRENLDRMRLQSSLGIPMPLVAGSGSVLGLWVVESVGEEQTIFARRGAPRRIGFSMRMRRYDGGLRAFLPF